MIQIKGYWLLNGSKIWYQQRRRFNDVDKLERFRDANGDVLFSYKEIHEKLRDLIIKEFMRTTPTIRLLAIKYGVSVSYVSRVISNHLRLQK